MAQLFDGARERGIAAEQLIAGVPHDLAYLSNPKNHLSWESLVTILGALEDQGFRPSDFEALGRAIPRLPSAGFVLRLANSVVDARQLFVAGMRWLAPSLFPIVDIRASQLPDGRLMLTLEVPTSRPGCESFFYVNKGLVVAGPELLGLPFAQVDAEITPHRAVFYVLPPSELAWWPRLRLRARALVSSSSLIDELGYKQDELRQGLRDLMRARSDFRQVIEALPVLVCISRGSTTVYVNPAFREALGLTEAEVAERGLLALAHPEDRGALARHLNAHSEAAAVLAGELRFIGIDDREVMLEVGPAQRVHFDGEPAMLFVARDVTARLQLEAELERADRLSALGRLVASVGHELNNPLAYVSLHLRRLQDLLPMQQGGEAGESLRAATEGLARAHSVVSELVTFTRGAEHSAELLDLREVVDASAELVGKQIEQCGRLTRDFTPTPLVRANRARLEQVVINLLLNAAQSFVSRSREHNEIRLRIGPDGERTAVIEVTDNGRGMSAEVQAQLFQPFFTTRLSGGGTGLGLTICHEIVTKMGGEISVDSRIDHGSCFSVRLPVEEGAARAELTGTPSEESTPAGIAHVLVVDDEPNLTTVLEVLLQDEGHQVTVAHSGAQALGVLAQQDQFDLVLCDLMMRDVSGMELYERMLVDHPEQATKMMFMTGGAFTEPAREFLERVDIPCLQKPFDFDRLLAHVRRVAAG